MYLFTRCKTQWFSKFYNHRQKIKDRKDKDRWSVLVVKIPFQTIVHRRGKEVYNRVIGRVSIYSSVEEELPCFGGGTLRDLLIVIPSGSAIRRRFESRDSRTFALPLTVLEDWTGKKGSEMRPSISTCALQTRAPRGLCCNGRFPLVR